MAAPPTPITDAATALVNSLATCLAEAELGEVANVGVVFVNPCIPPGCCDVLIGRVLTPTLDRGCLPDLWELEVWFGTCSPVCVANVEDLDGWLTQQLALTERLEQVLSVMTTCLRCDAGQTCPEVRRVEQFDRGGCAGWRVTYRLG